MIFSQADEFQKELKSYTKRWRSLPGDLLRAQALITRLYADEDSPETMEFRRAFFATKNAAIITKTDDGREAVKMRLDCDSLGTSDKIRIVFVCVRTATTITFIELFAKNDKAREDAQRIKRYLKNL